MRSVCVIIWNNPKESNKYIPMAYDSAVIGEETLSVCQF